MCANIKNDCLLRNKCALNVALGRCHAHSHGTGRRVGNGSHIIGMPNRIPAKQRVFPACKRQKNEKGANELTCKLVKLFQMFSLYLSTYVLVLIGVDRWIAVKYPMKSLNMAKRCHRLLGGTYILSLVLSLPQVSGGY